MELLNIGNQKMPTKCKDLSLSVNRLVPLEIKVQPDLGCSFSVSFNYIIKG